MPRSFLSQELQVAASATYDDAISSAHTIGVAEAQTSLEGDANVVRTLINDIIGKTNWYDAGRMSIEGIAGKFFIELLHKSGFDNVSVTSGSTTAFDTSIKTIVNHNDGGGNSSTEGVVVNGTLPYKISVRDHATQDPINDGSNNEVYGRLTWNGTNYLVTWYSMVAGVETAYSFASAQTVDIAYVSKSSPYDALTWERFLDFGFHDVSGMVGTIDDDNVLVNGMQYFLNALTTQAQVNARVDLLGHADTNSEGAHFVKINDSATGGSNGYFTGDNTQAAFNELKAQIGGTTSTTYNFTEDNVLADNDAIYAALNKLDLKWGDLASVATGEGASLIGVEDSGAYFTGTDVEAVLQEIGQKIEDVSGWEKESTTTVSPISSGVSWTLPGSISYTPNSGKNLDIYLEGQLLLEGVGNDYTEVAGAPSTQIQFLFTVPANKNITVMARK